MILTIKINSDTAPDIKCLQYMPTGQATKCYFLMEIEQIFFLDKNAKSSLHLSVWYRTKIGSQNLATKFGNQLCMATKIGSHS